MKVSIVFQHVRNASSRPDDITLTDVPTPITGEPIVPNVGDIVSDLVCYPDADRGQHKTFKVVARHFFYTRDIAEGGGIGSANDCQIYVFVTPVQGDEPGVDIKS